MVRATPRVGPWRGWLLSDAAATWMSPKWSNGLRRVLAEIPFRPANGDGGRAHAQYVTRAAAAYSSSQVLVEQWTETSAAAAWAGRREQGEIVLIQGHRLRSADLIDTLIVEATTHYLDLTVNLSAPPAPASALLHVRRVLDGLLGTQLQLEWDDVEYALKVTGPVALTAADRDRLGDLVLKIPLLG